MNREHIARNIGTPESFWLKCVDDRRALRLGRKEPKVIEAPVSVPVMEATTYFVRPMYGKRRAVYRQNGLTVKVHASSPKEALSTARKMYPHATACVVVGRQ